MKEFIAKFSDELQGVLSGFDRVLIRGTLRALCYPQGMMGYLSVVSVLLKDFGRHVQAVSDRLKAASQSRAAQLGRKVLCLASSQVRKEEVARTIARREGITSGLVCVLSCVEPCWSFTVRRNRQAKRLELVSEERKCLHLYHCLLHPRFGFMHLRLQTWFPFSVQVCLNGREWLARQMDAAGLAYRRQDNCFPWVEDFPRAQQLFDAQQRVHWPSVLGELIEEWHPWHAQIFAHYPLSYYWSTRQSEWATDLVFRDSATLRRLYPRFVHHGLTSFGSRAVMRFLGRTVPPVEGVPKRFQGEVITDLQERVEGMRIKHQVNQNSIKLYDKAYTSQGSVLRAEVTLNHAEEFRVYRRKEGDPRGQKQWRVLRRGMADFHRRAQVSPKINQRYLSAFAVVDDDTSLEELTRPLEQPRRWKGQRVRALHPFSSQDRTWLEIVNRGEFAVNGFRNRDLQRLLFPQSAPCAKEQRRRSSPVTRKLRLLRAHGLIRKVAGRHRYHVTDYGRKAITAILTAQHATLNQLTRKAA
jgi:hypothetical protein